MKRIVCSTLIAMLAILGGTHAQVGDGGDGGEGGETKTDPAGSRELIRQWVRTERIISEEKTAWQVEKQRMQDLLGIYQKELKLLDEELGQAGASAGLVDENKEKYETGLAQYREARQLLLGSMTRLLPRMQKLVSRLPTPLLDELESDVFILESPKALEKPRDVLKSIIAVLSAAGRFNRTITVTEETRTLSGGEKMTVSVLYLGLCRAYYTSGSGKTAGVGTPAEGGWDWNEEAGIADDVRKTIAVYQKSQQPQLIRLPVRLNAGAQTGAQTGGANHERDNE